MSFAAIMQTDDKTSNSVHGYTYTLPQTNVIVYTTNQQPSSVQL